MYSLGSIRFRALALELFSVYGVGHPRLKSLGFKSLLFRD